ncbi:MAG: SH3 domain-containing protein [Lachnospiraceae bacterium]|nr:SH3 domain-containing protein [Lachnospiraceae bacterium]
MSRKRKKNYSQNNQSNKPQGAGNAAEQVKEEAIAEPAGDKPQEEAVEKATSVSEEKAPAVDEEKVQEAVTDAPAAAPEAEETAGPEEALAGESVLAATAPLPAELRTVSAPLMQPAEEIPAPAEFLQEHVPADLPPASQEIYQDTVSAAEESITGLGYTRPGDRTERLHRGKLNAALDALGNPERAAGREEEVRIGITARKAGLLSEITQELSEGIPDDPVPMDLDAEDDDDLFFLNAEKPAAPVKEEAPKQKEKNHKKSSAPARERNKESKAGKTERKAQTSDIARWFSENRSFVIGVGVLFAASIILLVVVGVVTKQKRTTEAEQSVSVDKVFSSPDGGGSLIEVPADPLTESEDEELKTLISAYFKARESDDIESYKKLRSYTDSLEEAKLESKSEYIEGYRNLKLYTKPGPYEDSSMVYVAYDLKLREFDQTMPAVETLVVCRKEGTEEAPGELYVYTGGFDESVVEYIRAVTAQDDVVDLFKRVDAAYKEIMDSNPEYSEYMASLKQLIRDGVSERLAAAATGQTTDKDDADPAAETDPEDAEAKTDTEEGKEEDGEEGKEEDKADNKKEFEVEVTDYVNVRASDSENADRIGNVGPGTRLKCKEQLANGWSHVIYEEKDAYIKSDYLVVLNSGDQKVIGKVTVTEAVNIRSRAGTDSQVLGTASVDAEYDLLEKDKDGWTKILYDGREAYIKSDYVKIK